MPESTKTFMVDMFTKGHKIPPDVKIGNLSTLCAIERNYAQASAELRQPSPLSTTLNDIQDGLTKLGNERSTMALEESYRPLVAPYQAESKEWAMKRDELKQMEKTNVQQFREAVPVIAEQWKDNNPRKAEVMTDELVRIESHLTKETQQLVRNEDNLQGKLDSLEKKINDAIPASERTGPAPEAEKPQL